MAVRVESDGRIIEGNPETSEMTAYQARFYGVATSDTDVYSGKKTFVPDPYVSIADINSDRECRREFWIAVEQLQDHELNI